MRPTIPPPQALTGLTNQGFAARGLDGNQTPNVKYPGISGIVSPIAVLCGFLPYTINIKFYPIWIPIIS
jgi:hypothetical protein